MAHQAKFGALTNELVAVLTSVSPKNDRFNVYRESAARSLRHHSFLRTNHFDVESRLVGLEERFRVHHREGLADALRERLDELSLKPSKWTPEILHLLLELSDQPTQKSRLEDLEDLVEPEPKPEPPLRWEDIAKEDGWRSDPDLWKTIDYSDGSDRELYEDSGSDTSAESDASGHGSGLERRLENVVIEPQDYPKRDRIRESQEWRWVPKPVDSTGRTHKVALTEFQICREVLFMLHGLSTTLFPTVGVPDSNYQMSGVSWETYKALITSFAEMGRRLGILRAFAEQSLTSPHLQVFQDCIIRSLSSFDNKVTSIEVRLIDAEQDVVVSLVAMQEELRDPLDPLNHLSDIIQELQESNQGAFRYLELLFDQIGIAQAAGKPAVHEFLGRIFFDCFQLYLRPIRLWMEEGELIPGDKIFFVSESSTPVAMNEIWQKQFRLRRTTDGQLHAPRFLHPSANKIFTAGKSIVVLKRLGKYESIRKPPKTSKTDEPAFQFDAIFASGLQFAPFAELFDVSFDRWIESKHKATSVTLKNILFDSCGLWTSLNALECLYFMSDGSLADMFSAALFKKLDTLNQGWHDRHALTASAQEVYSSRVDQHRLSVAISLEGHRLPAITARDFVRKYLPEISLSYNLRWPVQMILTDESLARYKAVFTFLLQLRRAHHMLNKQRLLANDATDGGNWEERSVYYSVRSKLLWFCNTLQTYLTSLVLAPGCHKMRADLKAAHDVDAMIKVHLAFTKQVIDEACLGAKVTPILECILDILDLTIRLEKAQALNAAREVEEMQELSRLSMMSSPPKASLNRSGRGADTDDEDEDEEPSVLDCREIGDGTKSFMETLREINSAYERHARFVTDGLRGVARATGDSAATKWDILAEMLEAGTNSGRLHAWS